MRSLCPRLASLSLVVGAAALVAPASAFAQRWPSNTGLAAEVSPLPPPPYTRFSRQVLPLPRHFAAPPSADTSEATSTAARIQLMIGQGIHGAVLGFSLRHLILGAGEGEASTAFTLVGLGLGAVLGGVLPRDGVRPGQAAAVTYGSLLGGLSSGLFALSLDEDTDVRVVAGVVVSGLALGTAGGIYWATRRPRGDHVEFAASMALWGTFLGSHLHLATEGYGVQSSGPTANLNRVYGLSTLGWTAASLTAGVLLAPRLATSQSRMRWINLAALAGWATGGLTAVGFAEENDRVGPYAFGSMVGFIAGVVVGVLLTTPRDTPAQRLSRRDAPLLTFAPGSLGSPLGLSVAGSF